MFKKLARAAVISASIVLAISRTFFSVQAQTGLTDALTRTNAAENACIFSQLPARQS